mmetsp:Transcript_20028/g.21474  ORF Transcript_20028/g.21474 Transcript_20028/m.21474 type:complete len:92 (+) Transcript_20028:91-366(+)
MRMHCQFSTRLCLYTRHWNPCLLRRKEAEWRQRGCMPNMRCFREDDGEGGETIYEQVSCGGYDFTNLCVKRERNELDSSIDTRLYEYWTSR